MAIEASVDHGFKSANVSVLIQHPDRHQQVPVGANVSGNHCLLFRILGLRIRNGARCPTLNM